MPVLPLEYSIPFVSFPWRTTVFSIHRETSRTTTFQQDIKHRLQQVALPGRTLEVILNMANLIDTFEQQLEDPTKSNLVLFLGLSDIRPKDPFDRNLGKLSGKMAHVFLRAVIIDRILWALTIDVLEPFTRYINEDFPAEIATLDMQRFLQPMSDIANSFAACEDREVEFSETLPGDGLRCGVATIRHEGLARIHNLASHLYYTASLILFLGIPQASREDLANEFMQLPIGDTLKAILLNKINTINKVSELQGIHKAVTGSILELLTDDFVDEGERFKMRFTLREFLEKSHALPHNTSASLLRGEQVIWLTLLELMGGGSVGTLTNTHPLISGVSTTSKKLEFESSPCLDLTSSFASVDPLIRNIVQRFRPLGVAEVPMEVRHWKNPHFKQGEGGGSAESSALVVATSMDQEQDEIQYLGWIPALSSKDVVTGNGAWSADSHAAALAKMKRRYGELEENQVSELPTQRRRIKGPESSRADTQDRHQPAESSRMDAQRCDSLPPPPTSPTVLPPVPDIQGDGGTAPPVASPPAPSVASPPAPSVASPPAPSVASPPAPSVASPPCPTPDPMSQDESCPGSPMQSNDGETPDPAAADSATKPQAQAKQKLALKGKGKGKGKGQGKGKGKGNYRGKGRGKGKGNHRGKGKAGSQDSSREGTSTGSEETEGTDSSDDYYNFIQQPLRPADVESEETFTALFDKNAWQGWEYRLPDPRARVHPELSGQGPYVIDKEVRVWKYGCQEGQLACQPCAFNLKVRGDEHVATEEMATLDSLLVLSGHSDENGPRTSGSLLTVLDTDIATWSIAALRDAHHKCDIHIVPADPHSPLAFTASSCEALGINLHQSRQVHANQFRSEEDYAAEVRQTTLSEFFTLLEQEDPVTNNCNFLDLPLPFHQAEDPIVKKLSLLSPASQIYTATPFPINSLNWALVATVPAMSPVHFDAGKFCTLINVSAGHKLWLVRDTTGPPAPGDLSQCEVESLSWVGCVLGPGHKLIMRPGREHIVFTLENSIVVGSHFLSGVNLGRSMMSGLREHFWGRFGTNTQHLGSETILARILGHYYEMLVVKGLPQQDLTDKNLAALLTMALLPEMFEPQEYEEEVPDSELRDWPKTIAADRHTAKIHAFSMLKGLPPGMRSLVHGHLKWIKGEGVQKALEKDSESVPP